MYRYPRDFRSKNAAETVASNIVHTFRTNKLVVTSNIAPSTGSIDCSYGWDINTNTDLETAVYRCRAYFTANKMSVIRIFQINSSVAVMVVRLTSPNDHYRIYISPTPYDIRKARKNEFLADRNEIVDLMEKWDGSIYDTHSIAVAQFKLDQLITKLNQFMVDVRVVTSTQNSLGSIVRETVHDDNKNDSTKDIDLNSCYIKKEFFEPTNKDEFINHEPHHKVYNIDDIDG